MFECLSAQLHASRVCILTVNHSSCDVHVISSAAIKVLHACLVNPVLAKMWEMIFQQPFFAAKKIVPTLPRYGLGFLCESIIWSDNEFASERSRF